MLITYDFIIFVEHKDRELETWTEIKQALNAKGHSAIILSYYFHAFALLILRPRVVIVPFCVNESDLPAILSRGRHTVVCSNYEQHLSRVNEEYKKPKGDFVRQIFHIAWSTNFKEFLIKHHVNPEKIKVVGSPFSESLSKEIRIRRSNIDCDRTKRKLVFLPMNLAWAFASDSVISAKLRNGYDFDTAKNYRKFSAVVLEKFLRDLEDYSKCNPDVDIVLRPHPTIGVKDYENRLAQLNLKLGYNVKICKEHTAQYWLARCDVIASNYSTLLFDAFNCGIACFRLEYEKLPSYLEGSWYENVEVITTMNEINMPSARLCAELNDNKPDLVYTRNVESYLVSILAHADKAASYALTTKLVKYCLISLKRMIRRITNPHSGESFDYFKIKW